MTKRKAKKLTFRQNLRAGASGKLDRIVEHIVLQVDDLVGRTTDVNKYDLMRLACGGQTKSLRNRLIGELANEKKAELEKIYNKQQDLPLDSDEEETL